MKIKIEILGGSGNGNTIIDLVGPALKHKGYNSYAEFGEIVARKTKSSAHSEVAAISRLMLGQTSKLDPVRAKAYSEILGIPEKSLLAFGGAGKYHKTRPLIIEDGADVTNAIKKLAQRGTVTVEDLVKEFLYMQHR
ncbi:MAG: hypothetical protein V4697_02130 [Patescibacteria group bacterium]